MTTPQSGRDRHTAEGLSQSGTDVVELFVNGTLMRGESLHPNLDGARFVAEAETVARYRLFSIADQYPAMVEVTEGGVSVRGELYAMALPVLRRVLELEPPGLGLAVVELNVRGLALGVVWAGSSVLWRAREITELGSWREYCRALGGAQKTHDDDQGHSTEEEDDGNQLGVVSDGGVGLRDRSGADSAADHRHAEGLLRD